MSVYYCQWCQLYRDNDWTPCADDPERKRGLICAEHLDMDEAPAEKRAGG